MKLALGTAQFGSSYGISNQHGKPAAPEMRRILDFARQHHISLLDTSPAYGDCEARLGQYEPLQDSFQIVTKISPLAEGPTYTADDGLRLRDLVLQSLDKLRCASLYGLLLHDSDVLLKPGAEILIQQMKTLVQEKKVLKIGVSIYTGAQIDRALTLFTPDIVQLPINVFDQRLMASGHLKKLKHLGVEIHARSIFLQGLLLMEPELLAPSFEEFKPFLQSYAQYVKEQRISRMAIALGFIREREEVDYALVGVNDAEELKKVETLYTAAPPDIQDYYRFATSEERLINPSLWRTSAP